MSQPQSLGRATVDKNARGRQRCCSIVHYMHLSGLLQEPICITEALLSVD